MLQKIAPQFSPKTKIHLSYL